LEIKQGFNIPFFADHIREDINVVNKTFAGVVKLLVIGLGDTCADRRQNKILWGVQRKQLKKASHSRLTFITQPSSSVGRMSYSQGI